MYSQLLLFQESKEEKMERELLALKKELSNVRKGIFARHGELQRKYDETIHELETLKAAIARSEKGEEKCKSKLLNIIHLNNSKANTTECFMFSCQN